jgi:hypothetical protein
LASLLPSFLLNRPKKFQMGFAPLDRMEKGNRTKTNAKVKVVL